MKPFYCRIGSKRSMVDRILKIIPEHTIYVEPFFGGGAVYFAKEPSQIEVINDLDSDLMYGYELLNKVNQRNFPKDLDTIEKLQNFYDKARNTIKNQLIKHIIYFCNGFSSEPSGTVYTSANPYSKLKNIDMYQERMKNTKIYNQSYEKIVEKYDSPTTFFYLDPPYELSKGIYDNYSIQYTKMKELLDKVQGYWLLSINDSPLIRKIFKGYKIKGFTLKSIGQQSIGKNNRKELFISNYDY